MAISNNPLNIYRTPGFYGDPRFSIERYRYYCDRINQFYKKFNMEDDERYLKYLALPTEQERENFISKIINERRNKKIDSLL